MDEKGNYRIQKDLRKIVNLEQFEGRLCFRRLELHSLYFLKMCGTSYHTDKEFGLILDQ